MAILLYHRDNFNFDVTNNLIKKYYWNVPRAWPDGTGRDRNGCRRNQTIGFVLFVYGNLSLTMSMCPTRMDFDFHSSNRCHRNYEFFGIKFKYIQTHFLIYYFRKQWKAMKCQWTFSVMSRIYLRYICLTAIIWKEFKIYLTNVSLLFQSEFRIANRVGYGSFSIEHRGSKDLNFSSRKK